MSTNILGNQTQVLVAEATKKLCETLGLTSLKSTQLKFLTIALAEVAAEEASANPSFAEHIKSKFQELAPVVGKKKSRSDPDYAPKKLIASKLENNGLVAINHIDISRLNPYADPDPFLLLEVYGDEQLPRALSQYSLAMLRRISGRFEKQQPGTKPKNKNLKDSIIEYIVGQVLRKSA